MGKVETPLNLGYHRGQAVPFCCANATLSWKGLTVTIMQDEDIKLLRRIVVGGGRKYTAGNIDRTRYDRLVDLGWLTPFKTNVSDVEYHVTEKGRATHSLVSDVRNERLANLRR